jgi:hypothetical protein
MNNLLKGEQDMEAEMMGSTKAKLVNRLDALLMVLKSCKGVTCTKPWEALHPDGSVQTLEDAMDEEFDSFYEAQPKIDLLVCPPVPVYSPLLEGPQQWNVHGQTPAGERDEVDAGRLLYDNGWQYDWTFWD